MSAFYYSLIIEPVHRVLHALCVPLAYSQGTFKVDDRVRNSVPILVSDCTVHDVKWRVLCRSMAASRVNRSTATYERGAYLLHVLLVSGGGGITLDPNQLFYSRGMRLESFSSSC